MHRVIPFKQSDKSSTRIVVVSGKYAGRSGHLHKGFDETDETIYVILDASGNKPEVAKQLYKSSIQHGPDPEPKLWEQVLVKSKKVAPQYNAFLNKLLEAEFEPTPHLLAVLWVDWWNKYKQRQEQSRCKGIIRVKTNLTHPERRKSSKGLHSDLDHAINMIKTSGMDV